MEETTCKVCDGKPDPEYEMHDPNEQWPALLICSAKCRRKAERLFDGLSSRESHFLWGLIIKTVLLDPSKQKEYVFHG